MAEESDYKFTPPDFDEEAFIHKEMVSFRTTAILFVWGILAALASWGLFLWNPKMGWPLGLAICALFGLALKPLFPRLGADVAHFKRREWMGTGFLFFFTWLSFFILAINPPVTDVAAPEVFVDAPPVAQAGSNLTFETLATDNSHIQSHGLRIERNGKEIAAQQERPSPGRIRATVVDAGAGTYRAVATASDGRNGEAAGNATVAVGNVLRVTPPPGNRLAAPTDQLFVQIDGQRPCNEDDVRQAGTCIHAVRFVHAGGGVLLEHSQALGGWAASLNFAGWAPGNATGHVEASFQDRFLGAQRIPGGTLRGEDLAIDVQGAIGTYRPAELPQPPHRQVQIPGPELGLLAAAVLAVAAVARRRKQA